MTHNPATWLSTKVPALNAAIVRHAHSYVGVEEISGANRSPQIDAWNKRAGAPVGSPWCASFATAIWEDCGAMVPATGRAACDTLLAWAKREGLWSATPVEGALVLYGRKLASGRFATLPSGEPDAVHVEIVARLLPRTNDRVRVIGGNTSWAGFGSDGVCIDFKPESTSRVLGYVHPRPARKGTTMRPLLSAALCLIFALAPPLAAQSSTNTAAATAPTDSVRAALVRAVGFARAHVTEQLKALDAYDRRVVRVDTIVHVDTVVRTVTRVDTVVRVDTLWRERPAPPDTAPPPVVTPPPDTTPPPPAITSTVTLPQAFVDVTMPAITGRVWSVATASELRAALDSARGGDLVSLAAGRTYVGPFTLKGCSAAGVVVTSQGFAVAPGTRVTPSDSSTMARLTSPGSNQPVLATSGAACGWRLVGLHVTTDAGATVGALVSINGHSARTVAEQPRNIILDRMLVMGRPDQSFQRCVLGGGASIAVIDSHIDECHGNGMDSQAFVAWQGSGPYLIRNNYLAGAGENVMFGGADSRSVDLLPSDITIRGNHLRTPPGWKKDALEKDSTRRDGVGWLVKNLLELKVGVRVLVEGNVLDGSWADGQTGTAIVMKTSNQSGTAPWSETRDVTIVGNLVRNAENGINLAGRPEAYPAVSASRFHVANNVFESTGRHLMVQGVDAVTAERNTFAAGSHGVLFTGTQAGFVATANVWGTTSYAVTADAKGYGSTALANAAPGAVWERNAMQSGASNSTIPAGTIIYRPGDPIPANTGATLDTAALLRRVVGGAP